MSAIAAAKTQRFFHWHPLTRIMAYGNLMTLLGAIFMIASAAQRRS